MTQKQRILEAIRNGGLCGLVPLDWHPRITRTAARVLELREDGHTITTGPCPQHGTGHAYYQLENRKAATYFPTIGKNIMTPDTVGYFDTDDGLMIEVTAGRGFDEEPIWV